MLSRIKEEIAALLEQGIITKYCSAWASPMMAVKKPYGKIRICFDFRKLNAHTKKKQFYLPLLNEILDRIGQCAVILKLDLTKVFHQIKMKKTDRPKTALVCPKRKFEFDRLPFCLCNAPAVFQQTIEVVLKDCKVFASMYIDDVIIFSKD